MKTLHDRIKAACAATQPKTKARNIALAAIKWRLEAHGGLVAGIDDSLVCGLFQPDSPHAQTFDGRDNEQMKLRYYQAVIGVPLSIVPCES